MRNDFKSSDKWENNFYLDSNWKALDGRMNNLSRLNIKCKNCGHTIFPTKDRLICSHCGKWVYRNEKIEFKYKLEQISKKL